MPGVGLRPGGLQHSRLSACTPTHALNIDEENEHGKNHCHGPLMARHAEWVPVSRTRYAMGGGVRGMHRHDLLTF